ncbi:MAG: radical SAM protein [Pseudomonas sp.]
MSSQLDIELARASLDQSRLELILFATEQCNFRCSYCYEDFKAGRMKPWVVSAVKKLISSRRDSVKSLSLSWFGGEPLAAFDVVSSISRHALDVLGAEKVEGNITTNAFLLSSEKARELIGYGVRSFHVALDGFGEVHDATRHLAGGGGTFERIWRNLLALRNLELDFDLRLRVHYSKETYKNLDFLLDALRRDFSLDERVKVYFTSINKLGGPGDESIWRFSEEEKMAIEDELYAGLGEGGGSGRSRKF